MTRCSTTSLFDRLVGAGEQRRGMGFGLAGATHVPSSIGYEWAFTSPLHAGEANRSLPCNAGRLEQEPGAPLGLVDPVLDQAGASHVVVLVANRVGLAQARYQLLVVVAQLREHVEGGDEVCVVVQHALQAADVADGPQRSAADLAHALGDGVGGRENLLALLVEEEMIVAEMGAGYMPMEILGL